MVALIAAIVMLVASAVMTVQLLTRKDTEASTWRAQRDSAQVEVGALQQSIVVLEDSVHKYRIAADGLRLKSDSVARVTARSLGLVTRITSRIDTIKSQRTTKADTLSEALIAAQDTALFLKDTVILQQQQSISLLTQEADTLRVALITRDTTIMTLEKQKAILQEVIAKAPASKPKKLFGFIPIPSRKVVAIVTAVVVFAAHR